MFHSQGPDYTQNAYIATQGPMSNTIYDFWLMVYQNMNKFQSKITIETSLGLNQQKIVMLTDIIENDESKCAIYFPQIKDRTICFLNQIGRRQKDSNLLVEQIENHFKCTQLPVDPINCNKITEIDSNIFIPLSNITCNYFVIKNIGIVNKKGYTIRKFHCIFHIANNIDDKISHKFCQFNAYHYWFPHWPDHRSPENIDVVLEMCIDLLDSDCHEYFNECNQLNEISLKEPFSSKMQNISNEPIPIIHW